MARRDAHSPGRSALWWVLLAVGLFGGMTLLTCGLSVVVVYQMLFVPARQRVNAEFDAVGLVPLNAPQDLDGALADLRGADPVKKRGAARWLGQQPADPARQAEVARAVDPLLSDPDRKTVQAGVQALRSWATRDNVPSLIAVLDRTPIEKADDVEDRAMEILGRFPDPKTAVAVARYLPTGHDACSKSLRALGPVAEQAVLAFMHSGEADRFARPLLKEYGTSRKAQALQSAADLRAPIEHYRHSAAEWLAEGPADAAARPMVFKGLLQYIEGPGEDNNRDLAVRALDVWASRDDAATLMALVQNPGNGPAAPRLRAMAMHLLGKFQHAPAVPLICQRLNVPDDHASACAALEAMGPVARDELMKYVDKGNPLMREAVLNVLKKIAPNENVELVRALKDLQSDVPQRRLIGAMWFADQKTAVPAVRAEAARALAKCLPEHFTPQSASAAKALKVWGTPAEVPALIQAIGDIHVNRLVMEALATLKDPRAIAPLAQRLAANHDRKEVGAALEAMGPAVEPEVVKLLMVMNREVRVEACRILQAVGTKTSLPALNAATQAAARRNEPDVVQAANIAAKAIRGRS